MAEVTVSTWPEFVEAVAVAGDTVIVQPGTVWDMNEIAPEGLSSTVYLFANVKGNGLVIRNLRTSLDVTLEVSNSSPKIEDIRIENILQTGGAFISGSITWATNVHAFFHNCVFAGKVIDGVFLNFPRTGAIFSSDGDLSCGFELDFSGSGYFCNAHYDVGTTMTDCKLEFSGISTGSNTRLKSVTNCEIKGNQPWASWNVGNISMSMINLGISSSQTFSATVSVSVLNTDMASGTISGDFLRVTDAEMRDAAYLSSIGFPIGVDASG